MSHKHDYSQITLDLLKASPYEPDQDSIEQEILTLDKMIDTLTDERQKAYAIGAFRALKWARYPSGHSPVSADIPIK